MAFDTVPLIRPQQGVPATSTIMNMRRLRTPSFGSMFCVFLFGCNSSGIPGFVKYTADGQYIIFTDSWYTRSYIHPVAGGTTRAFDGSFSCADDAKHRWVIEPTPLSWDRTLKLVSLDENGQILVDRLPQPSGVSWKHATKVAFGPGSDQIGLVAWPTHYDDPEWRAFVLDIEKREWRETTSEPHREALRKLVEKTPDDSIAWLGYIAPSSFSFSMASTQRGTGAECIGRSEDWFTNHYKYRLPSPDETTFVTIKMHLPKAMFARGYGEVTLTVTDSGKRRVLLRNNDLPFRLWQNCVYGPPAALVTALTMPDF